MATQRSDEPEEARVVEENHYGKASRTHVISQHYSHFSHTTTQTFSVTQSCSTTFQSSTEATQQLPLSSRRRAHLPPLFPDKAEDTCSEISSPSSGFSERLYPSLDGSTPTSGFDADVLSAGLSRCAKKPRRRPIRINISQGAIHGVGTDEGCSSPFSSPTMNTTFQKLCCGTDDSGIGGFSPRQPFFCGGEKDGHKVLENLFISGESDARDMAFRDENQITAIISIQGKPLPFSAQKGLAAYQHIELSDTVSSNIMEHFEVAIKFINRNTRTLVHCQAGISRSATLCLAYLIQMRRMTLDRAFDHLKAARNCVGPNFSFLGQLKTFEQRTLTEQERSPKPSPTFIVDDHERIYPRLSPLFEDRVHMQLPVSREETSFCKGMYRGSGQLLPPSSWKPNLNGMGSTGSQGSSSSGYESKSDSKLTSPTSSEFPDCQMRLSQ